MIYKAIVQPNIDYGITVYANTFPSHLQRIDKLTKRAARVISSAGHDIQDIFRQLKWKSFHSRRTYFNHIFIYRCVNQIAPQLCQRMFQKRVCSIRTSSTLNEELEIPRKKTETFGNTIFYSGVKEFNSLDKNLRSIPTLKQFVHRLRTLL